MFHGVRTTVPSRAKRVTGPPPFFQHFCPSQEALSGGEGWT